jgi:hypothetical protein
MGSGERRATMRCCYAAFQADGWYLRSDIIWAKAKANA